MKNIWNYLKNNVYIKNILLALIIVVGLVFVTLWGLDIYTRHGEAVVVPDVKGLKVAEAATFFESQDLRYNVVDSVYNEHSAPGCIVKTIPEAGSKVKKERIIFVTINTAGPPALIIPDVVDQSQRHAMSMLSALGFTNVNVEYVPAAFKDLVVGLESKGQQLHPGDRVSANQRLVLKVSSGSVEYISNADSVTVEENEEDDAGDTWF